LDTAARRRWLELAYDNWWASNKHTAGNTLYFLLAAFAIFLILNFQVVGMAAVYLALGTYFVAEPRADWLNRDGRYGWTPLARVFRTVLLGIALLGTTLTAVVLSLGVNNYVWVLAVVLVYVVVVPLFTVVPWLVFGRAEDKTKQRRVSSIVESMTANGVDLNRDYEHMAPYVAEIERCRKARIRPLRLRTFSVSTYAILVLLPVVLAIAQIYFQV